MSVLKLLVVKLSKIGFHILNTHSLGCISHKQVCCYFCYHGVKFFVAMYEKCLLSFLLHENIQVVTCQHPIRYILHFILGKVPKIHVSENTGISGFRSRLCLCTALWTSAGQACYSVPSASCTSNSELQAHTPVLTLTCWWVVAASVKKLWLHTSNGLHMSGWALQYYVNEINSAFKCSTLMPIN